MRLLCSRLRDGGSLLCDANIHLSATGSNTSPYDTWAKAASSTTTGWADAITASAAGDDFYIDAAFAVSNAAAQTLTFKGTAASPNRIFSCATITNDAPVTADLGAGASFTTTGNSNITIRGSFIMDGVVINCGTGANNASISLADQAAEQVYNNCAFKLLSTGTCFLQLAGNGSVNTKISFNNTPVTINSNTNSGISVSCPFTWTNTPSAIQGTQTALANLFVLQGGFGGVVILDNVDFAGTTGIASGKNIVGASAAGFVVQIADGKILSGANVAARPTGPSTVIDSIVTDSGATNYKQRRDTYQGTLTQSTTVYNGATDGTTPISWQVVTTANAKPQSPFECFGISQKVAAGTYAASKIFITSATAGLKTNDVWVEVRFLGSSYSLGSTASSFGAGSGSAIPSQIPAGTTPGTLAAASPAWGTGGLGNDYQLAIPSFTVAVDSEVWFIIKFGKASLTANADPKAVVA